MPYSTRDREFLKAFGSRLRRARQHKKWSQEELAFRCGLHRTYIGAVERGERNIALLNLQKLAGSLGCSISDLLNS